MDQIHRYESVMLLLWKVVAGAHFGYSRRDISHVNGVVFDGGLLYFVIPDL